MTDRIETALSEMLGDGLVMLGAGPSLPAIVVARAILAEFQAARIAVVELPEPDDDHHDGIAFWTAQDVGAHDGAVVTRFDPGSEAIYFNPEVARATGLAMLAAADAAEASQ